jgi:hypothetical protein
LATLLLRFGAGDVNISSSGGSFDTYYFKCSLPPRSSIRYYSVTENEGEG